MVLSIPITLALSVTCAPTVAPQTLAALVLTESGGDPLAIGVNGRKPQRLRPDGLDDAIRTADRLRASGADFDLGLGQINVRNLAPLGLSVREALDPCLNLRGAGQVLLANYAGLAPTTDTQAALRTALSLYNTGDKQRGFRNGYVAKVMSSVRTVVPAIGGETSHAAPSARPPALSAVNVFAGSATAGSDSFVFHPIIEGEVR